ncbi:MAG: hypothetical protein KDB58_09070 [Solirubrobacterales bacterium]|nr:hypothetical protein [Solirubrobacterales bacterium]MCB8969604.1 hypothetical protein [Thermoleophilales bacterium]MCO5327393.1 hypothetical protein [Solirubrobacterales bacterium]
MSRRALGSIAALLVALAALSSAAVPASAGKKGDELPDRMLITAREYHLTLSKKKLQAGEAIIQLYDYGEDPHDLVLQRVGGTRAFNVGEVQPGETGELRLRLKRRSTYRLWCSLADHAARGMVATLRTSRR